MMEKLNLIDIFHKYGIEVAEDESVVLNVIHALYTFLKDKAPERLAKDEKSILLEIQPDLLGLFDKDVDIETFIGHCFSLYDQTLEISKYGIVMYDKMYSIRTDGSDEQIILCFNGGTLRRMFEDLPPYAMDNSLAELIQNSIIQ